MVGAAASDKNPFKGLRHIGARKSSYKNKLFFNIAINYNKTIFILHAFIVLYEQFTIFKRIGRNVSRYIDNNHN